uniref:SH3 domain-containing protein n=1 Tax=Angiostrongylus costaricensis TaxID=334426 RepID=A0A0R3PJ22_ANGCS
LKRYLSRLVIVEKDFRGGYFASIRFGCRTFVCQPFSGEPRLKISTGDEYVVTRGQRGWIYGYKKDNEKLKGWVPRVCVRFTDNYPFQRQVEESSSVSDSTSKS